MKILTINNTVKPKIVKEAVFALKKGGLLIYPTETCYGIGADALNSRAIDNLLKYKGKRKNKAISVAVANQKMAKHYVKINETAENLYKKFLPGPLTVISQSFHKVDPRLESNKKTLGIRIPNYPLVLEIIKTFGKPITSTSANISGGKIPYSIKDTFSQLSEKKKKLISLIINAGTLPHRLPSSVVDTTLNEPAILRQGKINFDQLKTRMFISNSAKETQNFAKKLTKKYILKLKNKTLIFALQGQLGAGKTQFAKGIAQGLKINSNIPSPTFTIVKEYPYKLKGLAGFFYHIDAWRIASNPTALNFIKNYLLPGNIIAIEWTEKAKAILGKLAKKTKVKVVYVEIKILAQQKRKIRFIP